MGRRLATGGRLIQRNSTIRFTFNGTWLSGLAGDTLASALPANDQILVGRSVNLVRAASWPRALKGPSSL